MADLKSLLLPDFSREILAKTLRRHCVAFDKSADIAGLIALLKNQPTIGIHHLLEESNAATIRTFCKKLGIPGQAGKREDLMKSILQWESQQGGLERIRRRLAAGGQERYGAVIELVARSEMGIDVSSLRNELVDCLFDAELGTYQRAYWLFDAFVTQKIDLGEHLPKLVERAQDSYHSGQQLCATLCRYAEQSVEHAREVLRVGRAQGIAEADYEELYPSEMDFTATGNEYLMDQLSGPRNIVQAPEWFKQIKLLAMAKADSMPVVTPQTLRWGIYGVTIGGGRLNWFQEGDGSYSQSYTEFLAEGQKLLWIDRAMPEEIRQQLYAALGATAPHEPSAEERAQQFTNFLDQWQARNFLARNQCPVCSKLPEYASRGENNADGAWDSIPPEHESLLPLMTNLHRHEIRGCEKCGQLYDFSTYHDNIMGQQENSESLEKIDLAALKQLWLADIAEGGRISYLLP